MTSGGAHVRLAHGCALLWAGRPWRSSCLFHAMGRSSSVDPAVGRSWPLHAVQGSSRPLHAVGQLVWLSPTGGATLRLTHQWARLPASPPARRPLSAGGPALSRCAWLIPHWGSSGLLPGWGWAASPPWGCLMGGAPHGRLPCAAAPGLTVAALALGGAAGPVFWAANPRGRSFASPRQCNACPAAVWFGLRLGGVAPAAYHTCGTLFI